MNTPPAPQNPSDGKYWEVRYAKQEMGWDIGYPSTPLKTYIDQLTNRKLSILIPGAGNAYEAAYLWEQGFENVTVLDIAQAPLDALGKRLPDFPKEQLVNGDFFKHEGQYDLILEQTFFCSFHPSEENRLAYFYQMRELLKPGGKLVGLLFNMPIDPERGRPPYGGDIATYHRYFSTDFDLKTMETAHNSIPERAGSELFFIAIKR